MGIEMIIAIAVYLIWNLIVFLVYAADKNKAKKNKYRISESTLLLLAFFMGSIGAMFGMYKIRHKTRHLKFKILIPLSLIFNILLVAFFFYMIYFK